MSESYIIPPAQYLASLYGISLFEASSIAWRGVMATGAYKIKVVENNGVKVYPKNDIEQKGI